MFAILHSTSQILCRLKLFCVSPAFRNSGLECYYTITITITITITLGKTIILTDLISLSVSLLILRKCDLPIGINL